MLLTQDDAAGEIDWTVSVGSTINRAHQHGTNRPARVDGEGDNDAAEADENGLPGGVGLAEAIEANGQRATTS